VRSNVEWPSLPGTVPWPGEYAARYLAQGYWDGRPIGAHVLAAADRSPAAIAVADGGTRLSYRELTRRADGAAARLSALGLRRQDRVVVQLPNSWEFVVLLLACLRLGVIPVMALPGTVKGFDYQAMAYEIARGCASLSHVLVAGSGAAPAGSAAGPAGARPVSVGLRALCEPADDPAGTRAWLDAHAPAGNDVALFLLSGGTTGVPKLIARTHDDYLCGARCSAAVCRFGPATVYLAVLPMGHSLTLGGPGVLGTLICGGRVAVAPSPAPARAFATIERERVTFAAVVPAVAQRWMDFRRSDASHDLSSLRTLKVGGAKLADHLARRITPVLGCGLQQGYGMAEGLICLTRPDDPDEVCCATQGRPVCPGDQLMVVDDRGEPVGPGESGVLLTRGPYTTRGYYRAPEHNARAFTPDGWYRTGDIVRLRPDGNLVIEGRDKDMINIGGEKVSAEEVENLAYQIEGTRQAAAVAMPDPQAGEAVCLYLVPADGMTVRLEDVLAAMRRLGMARFKAPRRLVLVDSLPVTAIGKIDKKALREDIARRAAGRAAETT
jgi:2,3-dihydroxybenzoate-AMP ligase